MSGRFEIVKKGYDISEVDIYISKLEDELISLKKKDIVINNAIINAQIAADSMIENAKKESINIKSNSVNQIQDIISELSNYKNTLIELEEEYISLFKKYIKPIPEESLLELSNRLSDSQNFLSDLASKIKDEVEISDYKNDNDIKYKGKDV